METLTDEPDARSSENNSPLDKEATNAPEFYINQNGEHKKTKKEKKAKRNKEKRGTSVDSLLELKTLSIQDDNSGLCSLMFIHLLTSSKEAKKTTQQLSEEEIVAELFSLYQMVVGVTLKAKGKKLASFTKDIETLIEHLSQYDNKYVAAKTLVCVILSNPCYFSTSEYTQTVKHLIDTHLADKLICKHILSKSNREYWSEREQEMELLTRALVDGGYADRAVAKYIFSKDVKNISYFPGERELKQRLLRKYLDPDRGIGIVVTPSLAVSNNRSVEQQCENLLAEGTLIRTRTVGILEITNLGGIGHTGIVYIARSLTSPSVQYALKIVIRYEPERVISMQREKKKMEFLQSIGVVHPKLIEDGDDYCIKEWVEGTIGVKWFEDWVESGHPVSDPAFQALLKLFTYLASSSNYVNNLKAPNLVWDGTQWVVLDVGGHKLMSSPEETLKRYYQKFNKTWNRKSVIPPIEQLLKENPL